MTELTENVKELLTSLADEDNEGMSQGLKNLATIPSGDATPSAISGKPYVKGVMGFRRTGSSMSLVIAGGKTMVRYLELKKFIALVENMHDPERATILLKNFKDQGEYNSARGQELGRINARSSAIQVMQGLAGRVIKSPSDLAAHDVYYLRKETLTSFYLAAKAQIASEDTLETLISAYDGWRQFDVPLDPMNPYEDQ